MSTASPTKMSATSSANRPHRPSLLSVAQPDYVTSDGVLRLNAEDAWQYTAIAWPSSKKWFVLCCIFVVQVSMNFNAGIYGNAIPGMLADPHLAIDSSTAKIGQWVFLILYGVGCELWAPFSEEFGRKKIMQASLFLVNVFQLPCALAQNATSVIVGRALGGLSSAGGSVTLGICADMYLPQDQQYAVAFVVLSSVSGSVVGPIVGGFIQQDPANWRWVFWVQFIFGVAVQLVHLFCPETDPNAILDKEAKRLRSGGASCWDWRRLKREPVDGQSILGPREVVPGRFRPKKMLELMFRPYWMLLTEPIVLFLSLLSGFSDSLIFSFLDSYGIVFRQWGLHDWQIGLCFIPLLVGYVLAYFSFFPFYRRQMAYMRVHGAECMAPERRLYWLLWLAPLEAIGLFAFGALSLGPSSGIPWIAPLLVSTLVGIANYAIYLATIDYMVASYGHYSASATGGNGFSRDVLAGIAAIYTGPFYNNLSEPFSLQKPTWILGCLATLVILPLYVFYFKGEWFRERSNFAKKINEKRRKVIEHRDRENGVASSPPTGPAPVAAPAPLVINEDPEKAVPLTSNALDMAMQPARAETVINATYAEEPPMRTDRGMSHDTAQTGSSSGAESALKGVGAVKPKESV